MLVLQASLAKEGFVWDVEDRRRRSLYRLCITSVREYFGRWRVGDVAIL